MEYIGYSQTIGKPFIGWDSSIPKKERNRFIKFMKDMCKPKELIGEHIISKELIKGYEWDFAYIYDMVERCMNSTYPQFYNKSFNLNSSKETDETITFDIFKKK